MWNSSKIRTQIGKWYTHIFYRSVNRISWLMHVMNLISGKFFLTKSSLYLCKQWHDLFSGHGRMAWCNYHFTALYHRKNGKLLQKHVSTIARQQIYFWNIFHFVYLIFACCLLKQEQGMENMRAFTREESHFPCNCYSFAIFSSCLLWPATRTTFTHRTP